MRIFVLIFYFLMVTTYSFVAEAAGKNKKALLPPGVYLSQLQAILIAKEAMVHKGKDKYYRIEPPEDVSLKLSDHNRGKDRWEVTYVPKDRSKTHYNWLVCVDAKSGKIICFKKGTGSIFPTLSLI